MSDWQCVHCGSSMGVEEQGNAYYTREINKDGEEVGGLDIVDTVQIWGWVCLNPLCRKELTKDEIPSKSREVKVHALG